MAASMESDIAVAKVTSMVVLGGAAFLVTLLPVVVGRKVSSKKCPEVEKDNSRMDYILSMFLSFGGGVLLCTTFLHLLPEVTENIEILQKTGIIPKDLPLPLPELIMCCGFFVMYIVEEVVHKYLHSRQMRKTKKGCDHSLNVSSTVLVDTELTPTETYKEILKQDVFNVSLTHSIEEDIRIIPSVAKNYGSSSFAGSMRGEVNHNHDLYHDPDHDLHYDHDHQHHDHHSLHHHHPDHEFDDHHMVTDKAPSLRELLIVLALTIHEGFEGMAIGLEASVDAVWYLMTAVVVHKCVIAFCIGVELVSGRVSLPLSVFYAFIYSCASPFGIGIGLLLTSSDNTHLTALCSVVLQGMATGTLLYVVFFEILKRDGHGEAGLSQMVVVIVGFSLMAAVTVLIDA